MGRRNGTRSLAAAALTRSASWRGPVGVRHAGHERAVGQGLRQGAHTHAFVRRSASRGRRRAGRTILLSKPLFLFCA
eukprot:scaffold5980_cov376-Prasinococcus_capsulatus_cf.AAC.3